MKGVFEASKKDGSVYYRASITYRSKHISLGSYSNEADAAAAYEEAVQVLSKKTHRIDRELLTSSYKKGKNKLDFDKYITLINFRDNGIYLKTLYISSRHIYSISLKKTVFSNLTRMTSFIIPITRLWPEEDTSLSTITAHRGEY